MVEDKKKLKPNNKVSMKVTAKRSLSKEQMEQEKETFGQVKKSVVFLAGVVVVYMLYLYFSGQMSQFIDAMSGVDKRWVIAGALCYVVYYIFGVSAYLMAAVTEPGYTVGVRDLMCVEAAGIFFNNLTPNGAGAAPAQFLRLTRCGLSAGQAGALQYTRFIIYEASEGIFAAIMLIFRLDYFIETYGNVYLIGMFLFGFKIVEVGFLLIVCLHPNWIIRTANWVIDWTVRKGWNKNPDHWHELFTTQVKQFSSGFRSAAKNVKEMVLTLIVTLLQLGCQYALPWFVLKAFGKPADLVTCLAAGSMIELLTSAIPLPGGTGGAEGGFAFLFKPMFGDATSAGFVVWRSIEYFLPTLVAAPLLSLVSTSGISVNERWERYKARSKSDRKPKKFSRSRGVTVNLNKVTKTKKSGRHGSIKIDPSKLKHNKHSAKSNEVKINMARAKLQKEKELKNKSSQ